MHGNAGVGEESVGAGLGTHPWGAPGLKVIVEDLKIRPQIMT